MSIPDATLVLEIAQNLKENFPLRDPIRWEWAHRDEGGMVIIPSKPSEYLYRGQNARYTPCLSAIARTFEFTGPSVYDLRRRDKLVLLKHLAASAWFEETLDRHPAVRWASDTNLYVNRLALAQHYGIPTGYIDLTESFDVAAFFATCRLDLSSNEWHPCSTGEGVIYRIHWTRMPAHQNRIKWIGLQPLPRPLEQWAWTCELLLGEDFERAPGLQGFRFTHTIKVGEYFLKKFDEGRALFPSDPLARVAERINAATTLPTWALDWALSELSSEGMLDKSREDIACELGATGVFLSEHVPSPLTNEDAQELEAIWHARKDTFLQGVGVRLARTLRRESESTNQ
jgi:hypothetical protein